MDDHQLEICDELENNDYIVVCRDGDNLDDKISEILSKNLKKYARDEKFLEVLRKEI
ncbi:unknown [Clostridium sp. CAG:1219]|nr:unknown [Clostridium sp. CAG:1219]